MIDEKISTGGFGLEAVLGVGAVVLSILGLAGVLPGFMASLCAIGLGIAFLVESGLVGAVLARSRKQGDVRAFRAGVGGTVMVQALAGLTGVLLGILALAGFDRLVLLAVVAVVFGVSLLMAYDHREEIPSSSRVLIGVGTGVLGILALVETPSATLILVALLLVGTAAVLAGSTMGTRPTTDLR
jgi:hypothetical protein